MSHDSPIDSFVFISVSESHDSDKSHESWVVSQIIINPYESHENQREFYGVKRLKEYQGLKRVQRLTGTKGESTNSKKLRVNH